MSSVPFTGIRLKRNRFGATLVALATGTVMLSACGSDNHAGGGGGTTGTAPAKVACGGKPTLRASGSTAQANAMTRFVKAFEQACPGQSLDLRPTVPEPGLANSWAIKPISPARTHR